MTIRYAHTNIVAKDWRKIADFYINVFDCKPLLPERNLSGTWLENVTRINNVHIQGIHLSLPGYEQGPTLEIFQYNPDGESMEIPSISRKGFGHIAFVVDDVQEVLHQLLKHGGKQYGKLEQKQYESIGLLTVVYAEDPEGNIIEIQNWQ